VPYKIIVPDIDIIDKNVSYRIKNMNYKKI